MELISKEMVEVLKIPKLYETEGIATNEKIVYFKYIEPNTGWVWYLCELDFQDENKTAFGYVIGHEKEWGYFSLVEMEAIYTIIRDDSFYPMKFKNLKI